MWRKVLFWLLHPSLYCSNQLPLLESPMGLTTIAFNLYLTFAELYLSFYKRLHATDTSCWEGLNKVNTLIFQGLNYLIHFSPLPHTPTRIITVFHLIYGFVSLFTVNPIISINFCFKLYILHLQNIPTQCDEFFSIKALFEFRSYWGWCIYRARLCGIPAKYIVYLQLPASKPSLLRAPSHEHGNGIIFATYQMNLQP